MNEIQISEKLVNDYLSLKNGERDLSKLTEDEILHCSVLEAELLTTAVLLFYQELNSNRLDELNVFCSPLRIISALDDDQISTLCETFVQSKVAETNRKLEERESVAE
ncbi:MAG: hypothetical protein ACO3LE_11525 [Bdellovibrionota bacterium]